MSQGCWPEVAPSPTISWSKSQEVTTSSHPAARPMPVQAVLLGKTCTQHEILRRSSDTQTPRFSCKQSGSAKGQGGNAMTSASRSRKGCSSVNKSRERERDMFTHIYRERGIYT